LYIVYVKLLGICGMSRENEITVTLIFNYKVQSLPFYEANLPEAYLI